MEVVFLSGLRVGFGEGFRGGIGDIGGVREVDCEMGSGVSGVFEGVSWVVGVIFVGLGGSRSVGGSFSNVVFIEIFVEFRGSFGVDGVGFLYFILLGYWL